MGDHVVTKAASIDASAVVDLYHVEQYGETQVLAFLDKAVNDVTSAEHASLYEFLLAVFTEVDARSAGVLTFKEFDALLTRAAQVPRTFGLAPPDASAEFRKAAFEKMEDKAMGGVTFRTLVAWTTDHAKGKIADQKAARATRSEDLSGVFSCRQGCSCNRLFHRRVVCDPALNAG